MPESETAAVDVWIEMQNAVKRMRLAMENSARETCERAQRSRETGGDEGQRKYGRAKKNVCGRLNALIQRIQTRLAGGTTIAVSGSGSREALLRHLSRLTRERAQHNCGSPAGEVVVGGSTTSLGWYQRGGGP
jgi:broad specificity phosphatase PhoE